MMFGMSFSTFTTVHVIISLIAIFAGFIVLFGMFSAKRLDILTALFLVTTVLTSVTGFYFPRSDLLPSHIVGIISLVVLAIAILALYAYQLARSWRWIYVACAVAALYFNVFVLVAQAFQKLPILQPLAPTQSEPPFIAAQSVLLLVFIALGVAAARSFHPEKVAALNPE